nr:alpha-L-arabinofuranosidase C-terminal domain-containing protein [Paracidobacterium acidisoli]
MPLFAQTTPVLQVRIDKPLHAISPTLYGLMTEEINHSYDGGLYAELVSDRAFTTRRLENWTSVENSANGISIAIDKTTGPSEALPLSLKLTVSQADTGDPAGVKNDGYWGYPLHPDTTYQGSLYAKADDASIGPVTVELVNDRTGAVAARAVTAPLTQDWKQYRFTLHTGAIAASIDNHLVLTVAHAGTVWLQLVSLFPPTYRDRANGNRVDLMEKLAAMHPTFLRLPGGNYLEGDHIPERYEWKKTIGPLVDRPTHPSPWRYQSSDGMGLLEFLEWCEDLRIQPVLAVYAGYSMAQEHVTPGPDLDPYVQNALDEIQYVTGGPDTKWGAERVKDGHPAPFPLKYVEIGNEDFFDRSGSYDGRYEQFHKAIKAQYPDLQLIATTSVKSIRPDVIDDHFYRRAHEFFSDTHHYDNTDRSGPKIFVGEWATREGSPTPNMGAALGDAAWMTGLERNSDIVVMASYAPLFVNVNPDAMQWSSDLIGYDAMHSYGSPSYYAQVMFGEYRGEEVVASSAQDAGPLLFWSATRDAAKGLFYLKVVNASPKPQPLEIRLDGASIAAAGRLITLKGKTTSDTNTLTDPDHIVPVTRPITGLGSTIHHTFAPYSVNVLEVRTK